MDDMDRCPDDVAGLLALKDVQLAMEMELLI
jgi:hypothetical protein